MTMADMPARRKAGYGWVRDVPDFRDHAEHQFRAVTPLKQVPPGLRRFSLRDQEPEPPYDQGQLGSCTANAIAFAVQFRRKVLGLVPWRPSRLFIYYWERFMEGTLNEDSGAQIRDGLKVIAKYGAPPEDGWPYDITKFTQEPPAPEEARGQTNLVTNYAKVLQALPSIKQFLYNGYPIVFGFSVYDSFESDQVAQTGNMPYPQPAEEQQGGHAIAATGWDDDYVPPPTPGVQPGGLEIRNSWGEWGDHGHFWMPTQIALNPGLSSDFWVAEVVEGA